MSCTSPERELVTFWLAGTLDPAETALVARHLETCADCRAEVSDGRLVVEGLRELHLRADEVVAAAAGDLNAPHLLVCARCRDEVASMRALNADLARAYPRAGRRWQPIAIALAALAAAVLFTVWLVPPRPADDGTALRGGAPAIVELTPATMGTDGAPTINWTPFTAATRYRVDVFTEDGRPVWTREADAPPVRWPDDVPRPAGTYRFRVEALAGTSVVARSRLADLSVPR